MPKMNNDIELYMKVKEILIVKQNREMFVALENLANEIAWHKDKHI